MLDSIFQFLNSEMGVIVLGCLLAVSEYLASTDRFKANSIVQFVKNGMKWLYEKVKSLPKPVEPPKV